MKEDTKVKNEEPDIMKQDLDITNEDAEMERHFDFDTAASSPSALSCLSPTQISSILTTLDPSFSHSPSPSSSSDSHPRASITNSNFNFTRHSPVFLSNEASPMNYLNSPSPPGVFGAGPMLTGAFSPQWPATYDVPSNDHSNSLPNSGRTMSPLQSDITSPHLSVAILPKDVHSVLTIHPTFPKSRVETQIPIKITLHPMPSGVKRLHLPAHSISKAKNQVRPPPKKSPDMLELSTVVVCSSAMADDYLRQRALDRAAGYLAVAETTESEDEEDRPLNGGEVQICAGCILRERKRSDRKKSKNVEDEEAWREDEVKRVIVFNTNEIRDWDEPTLSPFPELRELPLPFVPEGAKQVDAPMRIACYCRHQSEKMGFRVIFTLRNHEDNVIAQAMTDNIMITDDHKNHNDRSRAVSAENSTLVETSRPSGSTAVGSGPSGGLPQNSGMPQSISLPQNSGMSRSSSLPRTSGLPQSSGLPQNIGLLQNSGLSQSSGMPQGSNLEQSSYQAANPFRHSYSTTDLQNVQHSFTQQYTHSQTYIPTSQITSHSTTASPTPRPLSRPASPSCLSGPAAKKRRANGHGRVPAGLMMTPLDKGPTQPPSHMSGSTGASSVFSSCVPNSSPYPSPTERHFGLQPSRPLTYGSAPATPGSNEHGSFNPGHRSQSMENLSMDQFFSAPSSAHPSRAPSPNSMSRSNAPMFQPSSAQAVANRFIPPSMNTHRPPMINRVIPGEGPMAGGIEVTVLGSGFFQGMELMFGDQLAITTTFWGESTLCALLPPAAQAGPVSVTFSHEHQQVQADAAATNSKQHPSFTYIDDDGAELMKLALVIVGNKMNDGLQDVGSIARNIIQGNNSWGLSNAFRRLV
ncbi:MAG: hypothetical protein M1812_005289 [Candelaria pacifica]|nr:MAG: hypothetical protein M1812_005289 [Candelaria pacifica]